MDSRLSKGFNTRRSPRRHIRKSQVYVCREDPLTDGCRVDLFSLNPTLSSTSASADTHLPPGSSSTTCVTDGSELSLAQQRESVFLSKRSYDPDDDSLSSGCSGLAVSDEPSAVIMSTVSHGSLVEYRPVISAAPQGTTLQEDVFSGPSRFSSDTLSFSPEDGSSCGIGCGTERIGPPGYGGSDIECSDCGHGAARCSRARCFSATTASQEHHRVKRSLLMLPVSSHTMDLHLYRSATHHEAPCSSVMASGTVQTCAHEVRVSGLETEDTEQDFPDLFSLDTPSHVDAEIMPSFPLDETEPCCRPSSKPDSATPVEASLESCVENNFLAPGVVVPVSSDNGIVSLGDTYALISSSEAAPLSDNIQATANDTHPEPPFYAATQERTPNTFCEETPNATADTVETVSYSCEAADRSRMTASEEDDHNAAMTFGPGLFSSLPDERLSSTLSSDVPCTPSVLDVFKTMHLDGAILHRIDHSKKFQDAVFEYRFVALPRGHPLFTLDAESLSVLRQRLLTEAEWRSLGIRQTRGWKHVGYSPHESNVLLFQRALNTDPRTGVVPPSHQVKVDQRLHTLEALQRQFSDEETDQTESDVWSTTRRLPRLGSTPSSHLDANVPPGTFSPDHASPSYMYNVRAAQTVMTRLLSAAATPEITLLQPAAPFFDLHSNAEASASKVESPLLQFTAMSSSPFPEPAEAYQRSVFAQCVDVLSARIHLPFFSS